MAQHAQRPRTNTIDRPSERGQALIEVALSLALVLTILVGVLDVGRAFFGYISIVNAAREGARSGVFMGDPAYIEPAVRQELQGSGLDLSALNVQYQWGGSRNPLVVTVSYRFRLVVLALLPFSQINLQATATMMLP